jgi:hypothetical protein
MRISNLRLRWSNVLRFYAFAKGARFLDGFEFVRRLTGDNQNSRLTTTEANELAIDGSLIPFLVPCGRRSQHQSRPRGERLLVAAGSTGQRNTLIA